MQLFLYFNKFQASPVKPLHTPRAPCTPGWETLIYSIKTHLLCLNESPQKHLHKPTLMYITKQDHLLCSLIPNGTAQFR